MKEYDEIRQTDRKALPKFLFLAAAGAAVGMILGIVGCFLLLSDDRAASAFAFLDRLSTGLRLASPWVILACFIIQLATGLLFCRRAKSLLAGWDGEDEAVSAQAEQVLNFAIWLSSMINILSWFFLAVLYSAESMVRTIGTWMVAVTLAVFLATLAVTVLLQKNYVNMTKRLYPEKTVSALDPNFQKKWLASCDEAEKAQIGECAYHAYSAVNKLCYILWLVFTVTALFLKTGILPVLVVCIIWAVSQSVYCWWAHKLSVHAVL